MKTWCFSDLHGEFAIFQKMQKILGADDVCWCLGDCIDRGPDGIKIIQEIRKDSRFKMLKGNHEEMMITAMTGDTTDKQLWIGNGGNPTLLALDALTPEEKWDIINWCDNLDSIANICVNGKKILLCHSGGLVDPLWDRDHIEEQEWTKGADEFIIHGHTPMQHVAKVALFNGQKLTYCHGHKICVDTGVFHSKTGVLFNIDTFIPTVITV